MLLTVNVIKRLVTLFHKVRDASVSSALTHKKINQIVV